MEPAGVAAGIDVSGTPTGAAGVAAAPGGIKGIGVAAGAPALISGVVVGGGGGGGATGPESAAGMGPAWVIGKE